MLDAKTIDSIAAIYECARMTEEQQNQHLINLEIRNLEAEVKRLGGSIARQRKQIRELIEIGANPSDNEYNLRYSLNAQAELRTKIKELQA